MSCGTAVTASHQGTLVDLDSLIYVCLIYPTGALRGTEQQKVSENPGVNSILENAERENNFEVEKLGAKVL